MVSFKQICDPTKGNLLMELMADRTQLDPANNFLRPQGVDTNIGGENFFIFAGPPLESMAVKYPKYLFPIGSVVAFGRQVAVNWLPVTEFGVDSYYHVPGKVQVGLNMTKIQTSEGDIYNSFVEWMKFHWSRMPQSEATNILYWFSDPSRQMGTNRLNVLSTTQYSNPASEFFKVPFGLLLAEYDKGFNVVRRVYAQNCKLGGTSKQYSASAVSEETGQIICSELVATRLEVAFKPKHQYIVANPFDTIIKAPNLLGGTPLLNSNTDTSTLPSPVRQEDVVAGRVALGPYSKGSTVDSEASILSTTTITARAVSTIAR